jgi:hypothetical protein
VESFDEDKALANWLGRFAGVVLLFIRLGSNNSRSNYSNYSDYWDNSSHSGQHDDYTRGDCG